MRAPKDAVLKGRVPTNMKAVVSAYAEAVQENESVILREAVAEYFSKRGVDIGKLSLGADPVRVFKETLSPRQLASYSAKQPRKRKAAK